MASRFATAALAAASLTFAAASSAAAAGPTLPFVGELTRLEHVPDIEFTSLQPEPGPLPTTSQCARAWNRSSPRPVRAWIAAQHPVGGHIAIGSIDYDVQGPNPPRQPIPGAPHGSGPVCFVEMYLGHSRLFRAVGAWVNHTVTRWSGGAGTIPKWSRLLVLRHLHASVDANGSIHPWKLEK